METRINIEFNRNNDIIEKLIQYQSKIYYK